MRSGGCLARPGAALLAAWLTCACGPTPTDDGPPVSKCGHACPAPAGARAICRGTTCSFDCPAGTVRCGESCVPRSAARWVLEGPQTVQAGRAGLVTVADLDHDAAPDLLLLTGWNVRVLLGHGDGTFDPPDFYESGAGSVITDGQLHVADLNRDGDLDFVEVTPWGGITARLGRGDGTFGDEALSLVSGGPPPSAVTFQDGDGYPDLLLATDRPMEGGRRSWARGHPDGTFDEPVKLSDVPWWPADLDAVDLDGDQKPEIAMVAGAHVYFTTGWAPDREPLHYELSGGLYRVRLGDVTSDGVADLVILGYDGPNTMSFLAVLPGNPAALGWFGDPAYYASGISAFNEPFVLADLDLDGKLEMAFATWNGSDGPAIVAGDASTELRLVFLAEENRYHGIAVADVDGNGWPDLVLTRLYVPWGLDVLFGGCTLAPGASAR